MGLKQQPFRKYNLEKKTDTFTVRLSPIERAQLEKDKQVVNQKKDSTAIKDLWKIGSIVIHDQKMVQILGTIFKNKRNNKRIGIVDFD